MSRSIEPLDFSKLELNIVEKELDKLEIIGDLPKNLLISGDGEVNKAFSDSVINKIKSRGYQIKNEKRVRDENPVYWRNQDFSAIVIKGIYKEDQNA